MSSEIIYRVDIRRNAQNSNIVEIRAVAESNNCFPKPKRSDEPNWKIFVGDVSTPEGMASLVEHITDICSAADGCGIREGSRCFEGPAYYRLWQKRLWKVDVALPDCDPAAVRHDGVAKPETVRAKISISGYLGQVVRFNRECLRTTHTCENIASLSVTRIDANKICSLEYFGDSGNLVGTGRMKWSRAYSLLRKHDHHIVKVLPAIFAGPVVIKQNDGAIEPFSLPASDENASMSRLALLQQAVGGDIEVVYGNDDRAFYVNADGIEKNLPRNELATREARAAGAINTWDWIKGHCVVVPAA